MLQMHAASRLSSSRDGTHTAVKTKRTPMSLQVSVQNATRTYRVALVIGSDSRVECCAAHMPL